MPSDGEASSSVEPHALSSCHPRTLCPHTHICPEHPNGENGHEDVNFSFNFNLYESELSCVAVAAREDQGRLRTDRDLPSSHTFPSHVQKPHLSLDWSPLGVAPPPPPPRALSSHRLLPRAEKHLGGKCQASLFRGIHLATNGRIFS